MPSIEAERPEPMTPGAERLDRDDLLATRIRSGDASALRALLSRDYGVAAFFARAMAPDGSLDADRRVADRAWEGHVRAIVGGHLRGDLRRAILRSIAELQKLDVAGSAAPGPGVPLGTFVADGDRWEGWWDKEPPPWPEGSQPRAEDVLTALRRISAEPRAVLVLRSIASLDADDTAFVLGNDRAKQADLMTDARRAYVVELDREVGRRAGR